MTSTTLAIGSTLYMLNDGGSAHQIVRETRENWIIAYRGDARVSKRTLTCFPQRGGVALRFSATPACPGCHGTGSLRTLAKCEPCGGTGRQIAQSNPA